MKKMRVRMCRQDRTNRETVRSPSRNCAYACPTAVSAHMRCKRGRQRERPCKPLYRCGQRAPVGHTCFAAPSHLRSSAGGHCPLMMRLTVSLSLHSATCCFPMLAPPPRSSRHGLLERRRAASAAARRVAHESRRGASSAVPLPHALPLPPGSGAPGGPAAVGGVRPQSGQACSWLLRWALLCSALLCAPPSDSRRLACAAAYRSAHDDRRGEA